ncbi:hypothetical protein ABZ532_04240 [Streptomyces sp. NPDC019396]|uniref:hypothetical protein n=1 Tax=Streptomyces sp. NPDC019396 TaxID=3154687 RepID=UPI0034051EB7
MKKKDYLQDAEDAIAELRSALARAGVTLPSLRLDLVSYASGNGSRVLVELGRCSVETARVMTAVLTDATHR